ncbi:MAG: twin-arginine translocase subunit TatC [Clostridiales bacterium]|nr:twin-arginine translocase subunit TatC [Clostridiales bacterium]
MNNFWSRLEKYRKEILAFALLSLLAFLSGLLLSQSILRKVAALANMQTYYFSPLESIEIAFKCGFYCMLSLDVNLLCPSIFTLHRGIPLKSRIIICLSSAFLACAGFSFSWFILLPNSVSFLLSISFPFLEPMISLGSVLDFAFAMIMISFIAFQLPIAILSLESAGIVNCLSLRRKRKYILLASVIAMAILTPTTDPVSLIIASAPLALLYEGSIIILRLRERRRADARR